MRWVPESSDVEDKNKTVFASPVSGSTRGVLSPLKNPEYFRLLPLREDVIIGQYYEEGAWFTIQTILGEHATHVNDLKERVALLESELNWHETVHHPTRPEDLE